MRETLPSFFGFEAVGVLMYSFAENYFFTDPDTSRDEAKPIKKGDDFGGDSEDPDEEIDENELGKTKDKLKKKDTGPIDYFKVDKTLTEEEKRDKIREIHAKKFLNFPTNSGLSGHVFKTKQLYISNNASKETKFVEEIDNQSV